MAIFVWQCLYDLFFMTFFFYLVKNYEWIEEVVVELLTLFSFYSNLCNGSKYSIILFRPYHRNTKDICSKMSKE